MNLYDNRLEKQFKHLRDDAIHFEPIEHVYTVDGCENIRFTSVTTFNHSLFPHFDAKMVARNIVGCGRWEKDPDYKYYQKRRKK